VSATNLREPGFPGLVGVLIARHGLPPEALVLEITETCIIEEFEHARLVIAKLRDIGVVCSIDDFGAGVTSLAYLSSLEVGELKLDRSLITGLFRPDAARRVPLVRAMIDLGHALGLRVVAEGIEHPATLALLAEFGCDFAQGYLIAFPAAASELALRTLVDSVLRPLPAGTAPAPTDPPQDRERARHLRAPTSAGVR